MTPSVQGCSTLTPLCPAHVRRGPEPVLFCLEMGVNCRDQCTHVSHLSVYLEAAPQVVPPLDELMDSMSSGNSP